MNAPQARATPAVARPAATLLLMRARADDAPGVEVLLLQRSSAADYANLYVFPGGGLEPEDSGAQAVRLSPRLSPAQAQFRIGNAESPHQALGFYVAVLRETFEEAGLLLARAADAGAPRLSTAALSAGRREVGAGKIGFLDWIERAGLCLATEQLIYFAHWITPEAVPRRFDTRFVLAEAPRGMRVLADQTEVVGHRWVTPDQALAAHAAGRMPMIEPTRCNLERLREFPSPETARAALAERPVQTVLPRLRVGPDGRPTIILPWDPAYAADPEPT